MATEPRKATVMRRVRRIGGRVFRRLGLLPAGVADGLGQDAELAGKAFEQEVIVYFPDTSPALWQLEQWYPALRELSKTHPVIVVLQDSRTARRVEAESGLAVATIAYYGTLDEILARSSVKMALYVSCSPWNFSMLRFTSPVHVLLTGGESGASRFSNQVKAYDFCFVDDQATTALISREVSLYDKRRCLEIGSAATSSSVPGVPSGFVRACDEVLQLGAKEWARLRDNGAVGP